jgi:hypothetical protein
MSEPILSGGSTSTLGDSTPVNLIPHIDDPPAPAPVPVTLSSPSHTTEEITSRNRGHIILDLKSMALPHGAPALDAPENIWRNFIE